MPATIAPTASNPLSIVDRKVTEYPGGEATAVFTLECGAVVAVFTEDGGATYGFSVGGEAYLAGWFVPVHGPSAQDAFAEGCRLVDLHLDENGRTY